MNLSSITAASLLFLVVTAASGCDDKKTDDTKTAAKGDKADAKEGDAKEGDVKEGDAKEGDAKEAEPEAVAREMIEHDLSSADPTWEGWVAEGPKEAEVMMDGVKGARIAAGGRGEPQWDVIFAPTKKDLAQLKENIQKGVDASDGKMTLTITKDEPGRLEWTTDGYGAKTYRFTLHMNVEGMDVTCSNNIMVGIESEEERELYMKSCETLKKKA